MAGTEQRSQPSLRVLQAAARVAVSAARAQGKAPDPRALAVLARKPDPNEDRSRQPSPRVLRAAARVAVSAARAQGKDPDPRAVAILARPE